MEKPKKLTCKQVVQLRKSLGLNQTTFWGAVDVTQSGGSRYERAGRRIPPTVRRLLGIVYLNEKVPEAPRG